MLIKWLKCLKQGTFSQQIQENQTNTLNLSAPELSSWAIPLPKCTHCASFCHLLQIITQLQCTPAGYWPGGFKLVLSPCCGIWSWVYDQDFKLRTPELKYDPFRKELPHGWPEQVQGNLCWGWSCFSVLHPRYHYVHPEAFLTAPWEVSGEKFCLLFILTCELLKLEHSGENNCTEML